MKDFRADSLLRQPLFPMFCSRL